MFTIRFKHSHTTCRPVVKFWLTAGLREPLFRTYYTTDVRSNKRVTTIAVNPALENELCFKYFDNLLYVLNFAHSLSCDEINLDSFLFVGLINKLSMQLKIIRSRCHNFPKTLRTQGSRFQFLRALALMQHITGSNSRSEFQLISLMSNAYLRKAVQCEDSQINGVAPAALAYLAALHFASSEYQEATRSCHRPDI